jgi:hypothetical protein
VTTARSEGVDGVAAVMPLRPSTAGGSGSFLVLADDGRRYWCKSLNNFQGPRIPITEQIVGRLAALIGAPVCELQLVNLDLDAAARSYVLALVPSEPPRCTWARTSPRHPTRCRALFRRPPARAGCR